ncbi:MAG TPA: GNAT family N-acetyltransferase [Vicinamibacterales bacterium]
MAREQIGELAIDGAAVPIELDASSGRLEAPIDGQVAFIALHVHGSVLSLIHTEVPIVLRGKRVADGLARAALEYARTQGMTVKPFCPFVAGYIRRHPEFLDLVDPTFSS